MVLLITPFTILFDATQDEFDQLGVKTGIDEFAPGVITQAISIFGMSEGLTQNPMGLGDVTCRMVKCTIEGITIIVFVLLFGGAMLVAMTLIYGR